MRFQPVTWMVIALVVIAGCGPSRSDRTIVAAGTTIVDSGFLASVLADYPGSATVEVIALGSSEAVAYAESGDADLLFTHEPHVLDDYLTAHPASTGVDVFVSEFVVLAPGGSKIDGDTAVDVFRMVADTGATFASRDDGSGTDAAEKAIWSAVPFDPRGEAWYLTTGSGMGATLIVADQLGAVVLSELGAYLSTADVLDLEILPVSGPELVNPYAMTVVDRNDPDAREVYDWLLSAAGRDAIERANRELFGRQVYVVP